MKKLVITLLVLGGLLVAADFGAAAGAEYLVSQQMRTQLGLSDDPSVRINGFPFLTQALAGDYRDVQVDANGVPVADKLRDVGLSLHLQDVRLPLSDVLNRNVSAATVDEVNGSASFKASDLARLIGIPDLVIEPDPQQTTGSDGAAPATQTTSAEQPPSAPVKLTGTTDVAGKQLQVTAHAVLSLVGNQLQITTHKVEVSNSTLGALKLPESIQSYVAKAFTFRLDPGHLPFQVTPKGVRVDNDQLTVTGVADHLSLSAGSPS